MDKDSENQKSRPFLGMDKEAVDGLNSVHKRYRDRLGALGETLEQIRNSPLQQACLKARQGILNSPLQQAAQQTQKSLNQNQRLLRKASVSMKPALEKMRLAAEASTCIRPLLESMKPVSESLASLRDLNIASAQLARLASEQFSPALLHLHLSETTELQRSVIESARRPLDQIMNRSFPAATFAMASLHSFARQQAEASTSIRPLLESMKPVSESLASLRDSNTASAQLARLASEQFSPALLHLSETAELQRSVIESMRRPPDQIINRSFSTTAFAIASLHSFTPQQALDNLINSFQLSAKSLSCRKNQFAATQRQTTQSEVMFSQGLIINKAVLKSNFMPLEFNEPSAILKADIQASEARLRADISEFKAEVRADIAYLRQTQVPVPQVIESPDPDACFDPVFWCLFTKIEQHLRSTIEKHLTKLAGSNWIRQRVPPDIRERWKQRQEKDRRTNRPVYSPIQYADFMDLASIIVRSDNWEDVFKLIFKTKEEIQISLQRLHPIRNSIAHSRPLSKPDILTLASEANQIFSALGLKFSLEVGPIYLRLH